MVLLSPWLIKLINTRIAFGSVDDPDKCFMTNTSVGALKVCTGTQAEEGAALGGGIFGLFAVKLSQLLWHICRSSVPAALTQSRGAHKHTLA